MPTADDWAQQQWNEAEPGNERCTRREVMLGAQMAARPAAGDGKVNAAASKAA